METIYKRHHLVGLFLNIMKMCYLILLILNFMIFACNLPPECENNIPELTYKNFRTLKSKKANDSLGFITVTFIDCDGDIGVNDFSDPNLLIDYYEKNNGIFKKVLFPVIKDTVINGDTTKYIDRLDTVKFDARIPPLTPEGSSKSIHGEMEVKLDVWIRSSDTVQYQIYIKDNSGNYSNIVNSPEIILK